MDRMRSYMGIKNHFSTQFYIWLFQLQDDLTLHLHRITEIPQLGA